MWHQSTLERGRSLTTDSDLTTVVASNDSLNVSTVGTSAVSPGRDLTSAVNIPDMSTVVMSERDSPPAVAVAVGLLPVPNPSSSLSPTNLWITEHGDLVPPGRIRRVRLAQDAINSGEECVYDTLWNSKLLQGDDRDSSRLVQAGYDYLVKRTRLSRKTIQRIIAKLIEKDFIAVETRADIYQRVSTVYRVFSYKAVLERNTQKGRLHVAKIGPGFAFAKPMTHTLSANLSTVDTSLAQDTAKGQKTTAAEENLDMTTVVNRTTVTVVNGNPTTVVNLSPYLLEQSKRDNTSSASGTRCRCACSIRSDRRRRRSATDPKLSHGDARCN